MTKISPFGRYRAFDADGNPLSGGKLYTYVAGTSTPKATYTDNTTSTANSNPVQMDADGYADVWLDVGGYKFILTDSNDVTQWTVDNIDGGSSAGYANGVVSKSSGFNLTVNEQNLAVVCTAPLTISLLPAAAAGNGFVTVIINTSTGNVTIDPNGSELIDGASSLLIPSMSSATIVCDSTAWYSFGYTRGIFDSDLKIINIGDSTKKVAFDVSAVTASTTRTLTVQDASGTIYQTGGTDVAIADGGTGASTAAAGFDNLKQAATTSYTGVVELATTAETQAGSDTGRTITPSGLNGAVGFSAYYENTGLSATASAGGTIAHGLGRSPKFIYIGIKCVTSEYGVSVGQEVTIDGMMDAGSNNSTGVTVAYDSTNIIWKRGAGGLIINNVSTGAQAAITPANWTVVIRAWA